MGLPNRSSSAHGICSCLPTVLPPAHSPTGRGWGVRRGQQFLSRGRENGQPRNYLREAVTWQEEGSCLKQAPRPHGILCSPIRLLTKHKFKDQNSKNFPKVTATLNLQHGALLNPVQLHWGCSWNWSWVPDKLSSFPRASTCWRWALHFRNELVMPNEFGTAQEETPNAEIPANDSLCCQEAALLVLTLV